MGVRWQEVPAPGPAPEEDARDPPAADARGGQRQDGQAGQEGRLLPHAQVRHQGLSLRRCVVEVLVITLAVGGDLFVMKSSQKFTKKEPPSRQRRSLLLMFAVVRRVCTYVCARARERGKWLKNTKEDAYFPPKTSMCAAGAQC